MNLLQVTRGDQRRYYIDGKRVSQEKADDLRQVCRQDSMTTEIDGDIVRHRSSLHR